MSTKGFSLFGFGGSNNEREANLPAQPDFSPVLKLFTDKEIYRPGDSITATVEIDNPALSIGADIERNDALPPLLVDNLSFEIKGVEKFNSQWFATPKPLPGSKQRRGEQMFLDCSAPSMVSKFVVSSGFTKTYIVRTELPKSLPPSFKGTSIRYIYYVRATLSGRWLVLENGHHSRNSKDDLIRLEARSPLHIWISQKVNNLADEGISSPISFQMDVYWKEKDGETEWIRANDISDSYEEGYDSSKDEISSVSSYYPSKGNTDLAFRSTLSLQSLATKLSNHEAPYSSHGEGFNFPSYIPIQRLSVSEVTDDAGFVPTQERANLSSSRFSPGLLRKYSSSFSSNDVVEAASTSKSSEAVASEGFNRGRSYNIRIDDHTLLRFSPRNSDSIYYFGDMIGGTLTFFHDEGSRRCLEVSITLEISETISHRYVHPSRKSSPSITKVQADHHEIVSDLMQTSFLFSIPMDGPMSFSTPYVSVQWALRFEFFTTPRGVDLTRYDHPLLIEEREKGDWILPVTVYAPPPRGHVANFKNEKPFSLGNLWVRV